MKIGDLYNNIKNKFNGELNCRIVNPDHNIDELLTDSRNIFNADTALFFAIKSAHGNDGHKYIEDLYKQGIRNFVVSYVTPFLAYKKDVNIFQSSDVVGVLAETGKLHRKNTKRLIAITGSRGKTTLKEMLFRLLHGKMKISRSPRSYNSKIGVPLSLWQIQPHTELAFIEAGISGCGEMATHANLIQPDTVIFTNIGDAHAEGFSSNIEKAAEKLILAKGNNVKKIIYPSDDPFFHPLIKQLVGETGKNLRIIGWSFTNPDAELYLQVESTHDTSFIKSVTYKWGEKRGNITVEIPHSFDLENVANALAFLLSEDYSSDHIKSAFANLYSISTRMEVSDGINGCSLILDSYTSDFSSLRPALDFMKRRKMPDQTLTLILSDISHEAANPEVTYKKVADLINLGNISRFIGIGETLMNHSALFPANSVFFKTTAEFLSKMTASDFVDELILMKGSPEFGFKEIFQRMEARKHETVLEVNLDAMVRNYNYFRSLVPSSTGIIAMVKAFGYGVGSYEIAKTLQDCGAAYLAVAVLDEGIDLRRKGINMPIMVMNPRSMNYKAMFDNRLEPVIYSMPMLKEMIHEAEKNIMDSYPVHIKLDTGMHRMGFMEDELPELLNLLKTSQRLKVKSVFSHLATADCIDMDAFTMRQLGLFDSMSERIVREMDYPVKRHILNSAGIVRFPQFHYDMVRLGIGLYGANTLPVDIEKPLSVVATLRSVIICLREIDGEETVGYSRKGKISRKSKIATIPVGYADGIDRRLGNGNLMVKINGKMAPTIGNICMDATMIDVTDVKCEEGDSVEIFGNEASLPAIAETLGTIPYEILTSVSPRVKRVYYRE